MDNLSLAIAGHVKRSAFNLVSMPGADTKCMIDSGVQVLDDDAILDCCAWPFVRSDAVQMSLLDAATEH